jgi:large-conductance mechanosensitive channel
MVKPAAHDSFYKCSTHFSLILIIIFNNYIIIFYIFFLIRVLEKVDRLNLKLSDENRVRSSRSSDNEKKNRNNLININNL